MKACGACGCFLSDQGVCLNCGEIPERELDATTLDDPDGGLWVSYEPTWECGNCHVQNPIGLLRRKSMENCLGCEHKAQFSDFPQSMFIAFGADFSLSALSGEYSLRFLEHQQEALEGFRKSALFGTITLPKKDGGYYHCKVSPVVPVCETCTESLHFSSQNRTFTSHCSFCETKHSYELPTKETFTQVIDHGYSLEKGATKGSSDPVPTPSKKELSLLYFPTSQIQKFTEKSLEPYGIAPLEENAAVDKMIRYHRKQLAWAILGTLLFVIGYIGLKFLPLISYTKRHSTAVNRMIPKTNTKKAFPVEGTLLLSSEGAETTLPMGRYNCPDQKTCYFSHILKPAGSDGGSLVSKRSGQSWSTQFTQISGQSESLKVNTYTFPNCPETMGPLPLSSTNRVKKKTTLYFRCVGTRRTVMTKKKQKAVLTGRLTLFPD